MRHSVFDRLRRVAALFLALFLAGACVPAACAAGDARTVVRVAYPIQPGMTDLDANRSYTGYTYEYLEEIAQYTGWDYEFVQVSGSADEQRETLLSMLLSGEVDLMGGMLYTEELGRQLKFSAYSYGTMETVLQVSSRRTQPLLIDSQQMQTIRIAVQSTTDSMAKELDNYCKMNLIRPVFVQCASDEEMVRALEDERADALLSTSLNRLEGVRTIAQFSPKPFYFAAAPNCSPELTAALNEAIAGITQVDPSFQSTLYQKYFSPATGALVLSNEEKTFVAAAGELRVGVCVDQPPFQYRDAKTGEIKGIGVDLLRHIARQAGLTLRFVEAPSSEELYDLSENGAVDLIAGMSYNYAAARTRDLAMTRPYLSSQYALLTRGTSTEESLRGKLLALPASSPYAGPFYGDVVRYDSAGECIRAVASGEAGYTYVDAYTAQYYLNLPEFMELKMVPQTYTARSVCFGVSKTDGHALLSILNKALLAVPAEELQAILYANTLYTPQFSVGSLIRRNPIETVLLIAGVFLVVFALLLVILRQRGKAARDMAFELQKHLRLYEISNDYFFEYDFKKDSLMFSLPEAEGGGKSRIVQFDMSQANEDAALEESRQSFLQLLHEGDSAVREAYLNFFFGDRQWHWVRVTLETLADDADAPVFVIGKFTIIDTEKNEKAALRDKAQQDSLTHLYNNETCRRLIAARLKALRSDETGALLLLDIDNFKSINDTYGHLQGDKALRAAAALLRRNFRTDDIVGRPGGDEFIVYMGRIQNRAALHDKCETLCAAARGVSLGAEDCMTISVGAAQSFPGQSFDVLFQAADQALYAAKDAGRDRFFIAPPSL